MAERGGIWRSGRWQGWNEATAVQEADSVLSPEGESVLFVVVRVLVVDTNVFGACATEDCERRRRRGRLLSLGAGEGMNEACACKEKTDGGSRQ